MELSEEHKKVMDQTVEFVMSEDFKVYLKANPALVSNTYHNLFTRMIPFIFGTDPNNPAVRAGTERLQLLRRCIDVGVDLAFMGYG